MKRIAAIGLLVLAMAWVCAAQEEEAPTVHTAFGNSLTVGVGASVGYPPRLNSMLNDGRGPSRVINRGRDGETTAGGVSRLPGVLSADRPSVLLLLEGTNDVTLGIDAGTTIRNLETMVNLARAAGIRVLIGTLPPRNDGLLGPSQRLNAQITALASRTGARLVDLESAVSRSNLVDHVHFNGDGYQQMANAWFRGIGGGGGGGGGCFVATAVYGDENAPEVERFRRFRDHYLMRTGTGRWFVGLYYRLGPAAAKTVRARRRLRSSVRRFLDGLGEVIDPLPGVRSAS